MQLPRLFVIEHEYIRALRHAELEWVKALLDDLQTGRLTWNHEQPWESAGLAESGES